MIIKGGPNFTIKCFFPAKIVVKTLLKQSNRDRKREFHKEWGKHFHKTEMMTKGEKNDNIFLSPW